MAEEEVIKEISAENEENSVLRKEIESLREELASVKDMLSGISSGFSSINAANQQKNQTDVPSDAISVPLFSTGNRGVPTNRQTDIQTAQEGANQDVFALVESLKADIKVKFHNLTKQEFRVFSAIYILEEQDAVDYRILAKHLSLTESSIRDYIMKMQNKGIPVVKTKVNNKKVLLSVRPELKQIASLETLMKAREPVFKLQAD